MSISKLELQQQQKERQPFQIFIKRNREHSRYLFYASVCLSVRSYILFCGLCRPQFEALSAALAGFSTRQYWGVDFDCCYRCCCCWWWCFSLSFFAAAAAATAIQNPKRMNVPVIGRGRTWTTSFLLQQNKLVFSCKHCRIAGSALCLLIRSHGFCVSFLPRVKILWKSSMKSWNNFMRFTSLADRLTE